MSEDNLQWKEVLKAAEYEDDFCCKDVVSDIKKYFMPFWGNHIPFNFPYDVDSKTCDELVQDLEDIENDGILIWMNKHYSREWTSYYNTGKLSDMQTISNMILTNYRDCSEYHSVNANMGDLR